MRNWFRRVTLGWAWSFNILMAACIIASALLVDGDGTLLGIRTPYSVVVGMTLYAFGIVSSVYVVIQDPSLLGKGVAVALLVLYGALAIPSVAWW